MSLEIKTFSHKDLIFDPNNYRFHETHDYVVASSTRYHENSVQERALSRLKKENIRQLKESILHNSYLPIEPLIVSKYEGIDDNKYIVIEGNRRLAAIRLIVEEHNAGREVNPEVLASFDTLPCVEVNPETDSSYIPSLMGIRHVSGIKNWGGYQRSELIANLLDNLHLDPNETAQRLGLTVTEVNRRYRAFKALEQMKTDSDYSDYAAPSLYPIFHETVSIPRIKDWLGWDDETHTFNNDKTLDEYYQLITPISDGDADQTSAKISSHKDVRELRYILDVPEAKRILLDPSRSFLEAVSVAHRDDFLKSWPSRISSALDALKEIGVDEIKNMQGDDIALLTQLISLAQERIDDHAKLSS